jgi:hypothetical protein
LRTIHQPVVRQIARYASRPIALGAFAGVLAGIALLSIGELLVLLDHHPLWLPAQLASAPLCRARALTVFDARCLANGVVLHLVVAASWGALYAWFFHRFGLTKRDRTFGGAFAGLVMWIAMFYLLLPIFGISAAFRAAPLAVSIGLHLLFGIALSWILVLLETPRPKAK